MKSKKKFIGTIAILCCCAAVGITVKVSADKTGITSHVNTMKSECIKNTTIEKKDGSTITTVTSIPTPEVDKDAETDFVID